MGFGDTMKKFVGLTEEEEEIEITDEEIQKEKERLAKKETVMKKDDIKSGINVSNKPDNHYEKIEPMLSKSSLNKNYSMNGSSPFKLLVIEPKNFDECTKLVDNLKARKPVIINLERVETDVARKMFDFLSGATYALNGNVQRIALNIFIFAPENVDIAAKLNKENSEGGYGDKKNPWR